MLFGPLSHFPHRAKSAASSFSRKEASRSCWPLGRGFCFFLFLASFTKSRKWQARPLLFLTHPATRGSRNRRVYLATEFRSGWNWAFSGLITWVFSAAHENPPLSMGVAFLFTGDSKGGSGRPLIPGINKIGNCDSVFCYCSASSVQSL